MSTGKKPKTERKGHKLQRRNGRVRADTQDPTDLDANSIEVMTSFGMSLHGVADELGVCHDTVERWKKNYPAIEEAFIRGRAKRRKRAYACYFGQAFPIDKTGNPTYKGDPSLMIYWMKTREKWREPEKNLVIKGDKSDVPMIEFAIKKEVASDAKKARNQKEN